MGREKWWRVRMEERKIKKNEKKERKGKKEEKDYVRSIRQE